MSPFFRVGAPAPSPGGNPGSVTAKVIPKRWKVLITMIHLFSFQKRVARIVAVIAGALIIMSVLLVTITMRMSDHIDEMGKYIT